MYEERIFCQNDECEEMFSWSANDPLDMADGAENKAKCPHCGKVTVFNIEYSPSVANERLEDE